jgi:protein TonB
MEGGVPEGQVGGVLGGTVGGVVGGRFGGLPVRDYDQPPRLLSIVQPVYPQRAFVEKIQGVVLLRILIDDRGRVVEARVLESVPPLDAAAVAAVMQWRFQPARVHGRPVPTLANAPIRFRIY